jgi:Holliday junction resolvase RusA-like endonuclease
MIIIKQKPQATPRPRATKRGTVYYPAGYKKYIAALREELQYLEIPEGPLHAEIIFIMPRIQRLPKHGNRVIHTKRPDLDNMVKAVLDGLPIDDDARVCSIHAIKYYAASGEDAHIQLTISRYEK